MTGPTRRRVLSAGALGLAGVLTGACDASTPRSPSSSAADTGPADTVPAQGDVPTSPRSDGSPTAPADGVTGTHRSVMRVQTGLARLAAADWKSLRGRKVGVLTNPTGVTANLTSIVDVLHTAPGVDLRAVFGPEHGFRGTAQAGSSEATTTDPRTGLTVYDLYGLSWQGVRKVLDRAGVDTVMFDIQDVGARFYTYIWTLYDVMTAAAASGRRVVVLDRPNPLGGKRVAGPVLRPTLETGVGEAPIAQQHGMTVGELARLFAGEFVPDRAGSNLDLQVVSMSGWRRDRPGDMGGLRWIAPSPNIPSVTSALVYVGTCYFEGTNLSQGRGTAQPFELIGAPYVDRRWAVALTKAKLPGVSFREAAFTPTSAQYEGQVCQGVQLYVDNAASFDPIRTAITMLTTLRRLYPRFRWRYDTGDPIDPYWIDKLSGSTALRQGVDAGRSTETIIGSWSAELRRFEALRRRYLIYTAGG